MFFVAIGSNLPTKKYGGPFQNAKEAVSHILGIYGPSLHVSQWYETAPIPESDQPWYVNGVVGFETTKSPESVLESLHAIEDSFGRVRSVPNASRILDLDLLASNGDVINWQREEGLILPHPRLHERAFVLFPLRDLAPNWVHPVLGKSIDQMIQALPDGQSIRLIES